MFKVRVLTPAYLLTGEVEDQRGMEILEDGVPVRAGKLVDGFRRLLRVGRARHGPCRQQRRGKVGDRTADRLGKLPARDRILLLLDCAHPEHEPRDVRRTTLAGDRPTVAQVS